MLTDWLNRRKARKAAAAKLYEAVVAQSRLPVFFGRLGVADTIDGRFDLMILHVFLMVQRLGQLGPEGHKLSQSLFDAMFKNVALTLREMGIGDLGVPKHMKKMMKAFNGRLHIYHQAMESRDVAALQLAIARNLYRAEGEAIPQGSEAVANYAMNIADAFQSYSFDDFVNGTVAFPYIEQPRKEAAYA